MDCLTPRQVPNVGVGCAGWSIPREHAALFPEAGTHLARYVQRLSAVEINSSFYRPHRPATYARWAASVPEHFRFSVKDAPRTITHQKRLADVDDLRDQLSDVSASVARQTGWGRF